MVSSIGDLGKLPQASTGISRNKHGANLIVYHWWFPKMFYHPNFEQNF
jgi:hypothetical protein